MNGTRSSPLSIYLNDHLAGATAGSELARRLAYAAPQETRRQLTAIADDVAADRESLLELMAEFDVPVRRYKVALGWIAERMGRLKPNGHVLSRSPLSTLLELELLRVGIEGKAAGWRTLRTVAAARRIDVTDRLDDLISRAHHQSQLVEEHRTHAVAGLVEAAAPR